MAVRNMLNNNNVKQRNIFHSCYIILLLSFVIRLFSGAIFGTENIYVFLLLPSLLMVFSFFIYVINKKVTYVVFILFVFMSIFVLMQPEIFRATLLMLFFTMFVSRECDLKFVINVMVLVSIFSVFVIFVLVSTGIVENEVFETPRGYVYALGFDNPNTAPLFMSTIFVLATYAIKLSNKKEMLLPFIIFASFLVYFLFIATGTRTMVAVWFLFCLTILFKKIFINKITIRVIKLLPIIALVSFYFMAMNYNSAVEILDSLLSFRIRYFRNFLIEFSIIDKIFGNAQITPTTPGRNAPANSFNVIFLSNGIIIFLMFFHFYRKSIDYYFYNKDYFSISVLLFFVLYGVTEALLIGIAFFPNILFWILLSRAELVPKIAEIRKKRPM